MIFANRLFQTVTLLGVATTSSLTVGCSTIVAPLEQKDEVVKLEGFSIQSEKNGLTPITYLPDFVKAGEKFNLTFELSAKKKVKFKTLTDKTNVLLKKSVDLVEGKNLEKLLDGKKYKITIKDLVLSSNFSGSFIGTVDVTETTPPVPETFILNHTITVKPTQNVSTINATTKEKIKNKAMEFLNKSAPLSVFATIGEANASSDISGNDKSTWIDMIKNLFNNKDRKDITKKSNVIESMIRTANTYNNTDKNTIANLIYNTYSQKQNSPDLDMTKLSSHNALVTELGLKMQCKPFVDHVLKQIGLTNVTTTTYLPKVTSSLDVGNILYIPSLPHWGIITNVSVDKKSFSYISSNIANSEFSNPLGEKPHLRTVIEKTTTYDSSKHKIIDILK